MTARGDDMLSDIVDVDGGMVVRDGEIISASLRASTGASRSHTRR